MYRPIRLALAAAALAVSTGPALATDDAAAERNFANAARSFNDCLFESADRGEQRADLAGRCLIQETAFRQNAIRLRLSRGQDEQQATRETEADVISGRRMAMGHRTQRYASAR